MKMSDAAKIALIICGTAVVLAVIAGMVLIAIRVDGQISQEVVAGMAGVLSTGITAFLALVMHSNGVQAAAQMAAQMQATAQTAAATIPVVVSPTTPGASASV